MSAFANKPTALEPFQQARQQREANGNPLENNSLDKPRITRNYGALDLLIIRISIVLRNIIVLEQQLRVVTSDHNRLHCLDLTMRSSIGIFQLSSVAFIKGLTNDHAIFTTRTERNRSPRRC